MSSTALNQWKRKAFIDVERNKDWRESTEGVFGGKDYFGSGLDDALNDGTTLLLEESLETNGKIISV